MTSVDALFLAVCVVLLVGSFLLMKKTVSTRTFQVFELGPPLHLSPCMINEVTIYGRYPFGPMLCRKVSYTQISPQMYQVDAEFVSAPSPTITVKDQ